MRVSLKVKLRGRERVDECERGERARQRRGQLMGQYQGLNQVEEWSANGRGPRRRVWSISRLKPGRGVVS